MGLSLKKSNYEENYGKVQPMPPSQYLVFSIGNDYVFDNFKPWYYIALIQNTHTHTPREPPYKSAVT